MTLTTATAWVTTVEGGQEVTWNTDREQGSSKTPLSSLIISPNLDALLEYDERVRGTPTREMPPQSSPPVGLPPPPRRNSRNPRSPTSPKVGSPLIQEHSPTPANPYINPEPSLEEMVLQSITDQSSRPHGPLSADTVGRRNTSDLQQPSGVSQPSQTSKIRVDKLLGIGKLPFVLSRSKSDRKAELNDVSNTPTTVRKPIATLRERARAKGKLLKLGSPVVADSNQQTAEMRQVSDQLVLDIRRHSTDINEAWTPPSSGDERIPRRRPLLSQNRRPSTSSTTSSSSSTSSGPASTIEQRISISSTIYPASTAHTHNMHEMYRDDPVPIVPPHRTSSLYQTSPVEGRNPRESFIDIYSPDVPEFSLPEIPPTRRRTYSPSPSPIRTLIPDTKPPIPTAPKPIFNRTSSPRASPEQRHYEPKKILDTLPPTTNFLDLDERSDLIRKNRKLAKVFGQPPGPEAYGQQELGRIHSKPPVLPLVSSGRHHRSALSISSIDAAISTHGTWLPASEFLDSQSRRHSAPLSPDDLSFLRDLGLEDNEADKNRAASPTSFIDLSDDPGSGPLSTPKTASPRRGRRSSLFDVDDAEEARRRKRDKLAKLHRFLGSRVPTSLAIGIDDSEPVLPPLDTMAANDEANRKAWLRRRRSSSVVAYSSTWSDEIDRIKEDLNDREKAINVRRAQKMEKVFGVAPPQTLYHTRRSPSPSVASTALIIERGTLSGWTSPSENLPPVTGLRNANRSSYMKPKKTKEHRPGTSESNQSLLPKGNDGSQEGGIHRRPSIVYSHYQDSLNSLNDIIDRDDKESLAELHEYLNSGDMSIPPPLQPFTRTPQSGSSGDRRLSSASSIKSERRRSLPARTSIISIAESEYSITTPRPEVTTFQARRRRAAKLTQFFGVDYRELITDVLESIESGLEHEAKRGTLDPDEVEDLLARLRNLRTKRTGVF